MRQLPPEKPRTTIAIIGTRLITITGWNLTIRTYETSKPQSSRKKALVATVVAQVALVYPLLMAGVLVEEDMESLVICSSTRDAKKNHSSSFYRKQRKTRKRKRHKQTKK